MSKFDWFLILVACVILVAVIFSAHSQEPAREKNAEEIRREAVVEEFGRDYFAFARAFHAELWAALQAKKISAAQYADASHGFFSALDEPSNFAALYDAQPAAVQRMFQGAAAALRRDQRLAIEARAAEALAREDMLKAD